MEPFNYACFRVPDESVIFWGLEAGAGVDQLDLSKYCSCSHTVIIGLSCDCGYDKLVADCDHDSSEYSIK